MPSDPNPYSTPKAGLAEGFIQSNDELIRQEHIATESSIKSVAFLYFLAGALLCVINIFALSPPTTNFLKPGFFCLLGISFLFLSFYLRRLNQYARLFCAALSLIGLFLIPPVGAIINLYVLFLLFTPKSHMVFSSQYQEIIKVTPKVKVKTPVSAWFVLMIFFLLILMSIILLSTLTHRP